jgi:hypothetical protein
MARTPFGRIAFRVEGEWWNAYWAPSQENMEGAVHLASIRMSLAEDPAVKNGFMSLMRSGFEWSLKATGVRERPSWNDPQPAPERERAGRG